MRQVLLGIVLIVIAAIIWGTFNMGFFKSVRFEEREAGPFLLLAKAHEGPYHEIHKALSEVEDIARKNSFNCKQTFGYYIDDPGIVDSARLRSKGGCILDGPLAKVPEGLTVESLELKPYLVGFFEGSPWLGPAKVYSKAESMLMTRNRNTVFPVMEIYETDGRRIKTTYYFTR